MIEQNPANSTAPPAPAKPRRRLRFSLMTLMLIAAVVCLGVSHLRTSWMLHRANADLRRYRWEAGDLHMTDKSQVHVVGIETHAELAWRWRVFLPEGKRYEVHSKINSIQGNQIPEESHPEMTLQGGETYLLTAAIYQDPLENWRLKLSVSPPSQGTSGRTIHLNAQDVSWIGKRGGHSTQGVAPGSAGTQTFAADRPALLLSYLVHQPSPGGGSSWSSSDVTDGVMFWLEPE
jgi:hypothetical protein